MEQLPYCRGHCFSILILYPTTAASAQFCLLCCQPEPIPRSLTARMSRFTSRDPCRLAAWLGRTIHMGSRAYRLPLQSIPLYRGDRPGPHKHFLGIFPSASFDHEKQQKGSTCQWIFSKHENITVPSDKSSLCVC